MGHPPVADWKDSSVRFNYPNPYKLNDQMKSMAGPPTVVNTDTFPRP
jgi:hypothetical protein